jgi:catechol 2,3-dioxygenase-like lactoylglutathione lyase family enzyme
MKIGNVVFDCSDPDRVATFWAAALGYEKGEYPPEMRQQLLDGGLTEEQLSERSVAEDPAGEGPRLFFQKVPEGKSVKNRVHLDINSTPGRRATSEDLQAEVQRLTGLGASVIREHDQPWGSFPEHHFVMADPEGNEFCVQ